MTAPAVGIPDEIRDARFIVMLPEPGLPQTDDQRLGVLVPVIELMVQEGLTVFAVAASEAGLIGSLRELYDERALFGAHGAITVSDVEQCVAADALFVLANHAQAELVQAGNRPDGSSVLVLPAALTPNEVFAAAQLGAPAVQIFPAEGLGTQYPSHLSRLFPQLQVVPRGGLGGWLAQRWLEAGAVACCLDDALIGDVFDGGKLSDLRERCRTYTGIPTAKA